MQIIVYRLDFIQQYFHLWATYIEKYRQMLLPLTEDTDICPIHISDVCKVIESLLVDPQGHRPLPTLDEKHSQQVYTLTGPEPINGKHFVELLSSATGYTKFKFCHARPTDVQYYLDGLANDIWFDQRIKQEMTQLYKDGFGNYNEKAYSVPSRKL
jgi:hypothetical protein